MNADTAWYLGARREKKAVSSYTQDFIAGLDPFGVYSSRYGQQAEAAGLSEGQHALKRGLGTVGGVMGGSVLVPSAILGITGAAKGFGGATGGLGKRLSGALAGGIEGAKAPLKGVAEAYRTLRAAKRLGRYGGTLTPREVESAEYIARQVPLGALEENLAPLLKKTEGYGFDKQKIVEMIQRGAKPEDFRQFGPEIERYVSMLHRGATLDDIRAAGAYAADLGAQNILDRMRADKIHDAVGAAAEAPGAASAARRAAMRGVYPQDVREIGKALNQEELGEDIAAIVDRMRRGLGEEDIKRLATSASKPLQRELAGGLAQLGLGGAIGGGGAFLQYGQGRKTERETSIPARLGGMVGLGPRG